MSEIATNNGTSSLLSFIERAARDPEFDVNKFALLLDKQQEMLRERARQEFNAAMSAVMADIGPVIRDRLNPAVNRKYATLEAIDAVARPEYSRHGFAVRFGCDKPPKDGWMRITCTVSHSGGYSEQNYLDSPVDLQQGARARTPVQAVGSTITYLRRYLLQMAFNIVLADDETDDDGIRAAAAAAPMPRGARLAERAPAYEAPRPHPQMPNGPVDPNPVDAPTAPEKRTWAQWKDALEMAVKDARTPEERGLLLAKAEVTEIVRLAREGQYSPAKARIIELYEEIENRYLADPPDPPEPELPEVAIAGEEKMAAG